MTVTHGASATGGPPDEDHALDALAARALSTAAASAAARAVVDATELQALATLVAARRAQALAEDPLVDLERVDASVATEVSLRLRTSPGAARGRIVLAEELVQRRTGTLAALQAGDLDVARARVVCDAVRVLPARPLDPAQAGQPGGAPDLATAVESEVLRPGSVPALADATPGPAAGSLTLPQLRSRLAVLVARADAAGAAERHAEADRRRRCTLRPLEDGMALLQVVGRAPQLLAAWQALDVAARRQLRDEAAGAPGATEDTVGHPPIRRTLDQARVDVLLASLLGEGQPLDGRRGVPVELCVVAPAATVLAGPPCGPGAPADPFEEPGLLFGLGGGPMALPGPLVRELAADARWRRWLVDPGTGHLVGVGATTYRPGAALRRFVRGRDGGCGLPTCHQCLGSRLDADHVVPWPAGPTRDDNLHDTCRRDHRVKQASHAGGTFGVALAADGSQAWTTPTGETHVGRPACYGRARDVRAVPDPPDGPDPPPF